MRGELSESGLAGKVRVSWNIIMKAQPPLPLTPLHIIMSANILINCDQENENRYIYCLFDGVEVRGGSLVKWT